MTTNNTQKNDTAYEVGTTVHVAPSDLLLARNVREATPDAALVASVKDLGVIEPITAVLTEDGALLVRFGHRRTIAAVQANRDTVPVYITGTDSTDSTAEIARIIAQRDENTHRQGLTTAENVGVVEQLAAFGLSAAQIAKQSRIKRAEVDTALTVSGSKIARKATERYDSLTLDEAAVVAEFEDDEDTVKALLVAAHEGRFFHVAQQARDARAEAKVRAAVLDDLRAAGVTVIERPGWEEKKTKALRTLTASAGNHDPLSPTDHAECPGHVAWLSSEWTYVDGNGDPVAFPDEPTNDASEDEWDAYDHEVEQAKTDSRRMQLPVPEYGCADWRKNGHHDRYGSSAPTKPKADDMTEAEREAAKAQRKVVIENNKAWASAEPVRREFVAKFVKGKTPPKGTARFLATALGTDASLLHSIGANHLAATWLGKTTPEYGTAALTPAKSATDAKCLMHALALVLAAYEDNLHDGSWRENGEHNACGRYLRFLSERCGYALSEVEEYAISTQTA